MRFFRADRSDMGVRADVYLASKFAGLTRSSLERLFDKKLVSMAGRKLKPGYRLKVGDKLEVDDALVKRQPGPIDLPIIYEDDDVTVINKPEGVLTHSKGALNEEASVATFIQPKLHGLPKSNRAGIVHRLDRATSGVMITAKNSQAQSLLQKQFSQRKAKKTYLAIVKGKPKEPEALIDAPIERNPHRPQTFKIGANGKTAQTYYKVLSTMEIDSHSYSLLELKPASGRTHQIRVHLAYLGTPVHGDKLYGKNDGEHLYLHSQSLEITIPGSERKTFQADMPKYFKEMIDENSTK